MIISDILYWLSIVFAILAVAAHFLTWLELESNTLKGARRYNGFAIAFWIIAFLGMTISRSLLVDILKG